ncbi:MAG TPA: hypothetical protein VNY51_13650 [Candidatus Dormibacteraeota bacterium]|jgi:hypothetical protein|nr:hypothetical protein [Candidatus Dormibacteraeota bacterium]
MIQRRAVSLFLLAAVALLLSFAGSASAQDDTQVQETLRARYVVLPAHLHPEIAPPPASLQSWNGSFTYNGTNYTYNMVGAAPSTNTSATIPVYIIPVKIVITSRSGSKTTFDPSHVLSNGNSVTTNTLDSPIFDSTTTYTQGGVDVGTTQYEDAFQRANFWGTVKNNTNSHILLSPTVLAEQTLSPSRTYGKTGSPFGFTAGEVDINWFDAQLPTIISNLGIQPNGFPIFLTYDVYLTESGSCCIGGYHSSEGSISNPQSYAEATYVDHVGAFSQDVSALSHEVGEWIDDPLTVNYNGNNTPCGILEVGDPLENNANYGAYHYVLHGFTYNLQDLVTLPYFGAPPSTSVNDFFTFQGESLSVCQNGS